MENLHHQEIYDSLDNWATSRGLQNDQIVVSLLEDFANEENLSIWATLDPFEFLPRAKSLVKSKYDNLVKYLSLVRNILVFVPVALTWKAVSEATAAFGTFIESNSASTVNFLAFWQDGYDILPKFWTVSHVASLDFLIILFVIITSIAAAIFAQKAVIEKNAKNQQLEQERLQLALTLKIYLHSLREIDRGNIKDSLASSVSALQTATRALTRTAVELSEVMSGLKSSIPVVNDFGQKMQLETAKLNREVAALTGNLSEINTSIVGDLRDAVNSASAGLDLANEELNNSTNSIRRNATEAEREIKVFQGLIKKASRLGK
jgi:hypothetical protein